MIPHVPTFVAEIVTYIDGLEQERRNSTSNALELHNSCTNHKLYHHVNITNLKAAKRLLHRNIWSLVFDLASRQQ